MNYAPQSACLTDLPVDFIHISAPAKCANATQIVDFAMFNPGLSLNLTVFV
jgi:hypothetical protein